MEPVEGWPTGFSARAWLENWLQIPAAALAGKRPIDCLSREDGARQVSRLLAVMAGHVYA
jgi:uncharacterized protein (DUF2384 family)